MSKLPQLNLRIADRHHELVRQIAQRLRESGGDSFAADLGVFLDSNPSPVPGHAGIDAVDALHARVAEVEGQLLILEARLAKLEAPAPTTTKRLTPAKMVSRRPAPAKSGLGKI